MIKIILTNHPCSEYPWVCYNEIKEQILSIEDDSDIYGRWLNIYATY